MRWLGFPVELGVHFPLDTSTISVLGHEKGQPALDRWNARP
jgi:probable phosphoglycerate mutase